MSNGVDTRAAAEIGWGLRGWESETADVLADGIISGTDAFWRASVERYEGYHMWMPLYTLNMLNSRNELK